MSPLLVRALRRLAGSRSSSRSGWSLVFKVLPAFGLLGPSAPRRSTPQGGPLEAAQVYGADGGSAVARRRAGRARTGAGELLAAGHNRSAQQAALSAREHAMAAQREALARREDERRQARQIVAEIDRRLSELEELYSQAAEGKDKAATERLSR